MTTFSLPAFSRLSPKIARAQRELQQIENFYGEQAAQISHGEWAALSAVSLGIHNVYNGIEDILLSIARDVDGAVPAGPTMHQDILDQMFADVAGLRPPLFSSDLYIALVELKGFRHLVRHRYGFDLHSQKVLENLDRLRGAFPALLEAVAELEQRLKNTRDKS